MNNRSQNSAYCKPTLSPAAIRSSAIRRLLVVLMVLAGGGLLSAGSASAQQSAGGEPATFTEKINPMNWRMPSFRLPNFLVRNDEQERIVERKNGLVTDVKGTASRSWQRTKETFNPARLNPMNMFTGPTTPPSEEKKPGFFSSLLGPPAPPPEERVATVNEWLGQERP